MKKILTIFISTSVLACMPLDKANSAQNTYTSDVAGVNTASNVPDFTYVYDKVGKSVVHISTILASGGNQAAGLTGDPFFDQFLRQMLPDQQQKLQKQRGLGSGFILSSDGYILTNAHVVDKADIVTVKLNDRREFKAKIVGVDKLTDVALLKIEATNLPEVQVGDPNKLRSGNWVAAIGSPFGLENTITHGIVSALSRNLPEETSVPFIQTDVPVNPGNSGGPLINMQAQVIGINSQIYSKSGGYMGISFAIPIDYATRIADQIKRTGKVEHGRLGIAIQPLTEELAPSFGLSSSRGVLVNDVSPDSAASQAGIQIGDVILAANDKEIDEGVSLSSLISNLGPDQAVKLTIWRDNKEITLNAITMLATNDASIQAINKPLTNRGLSVDKLGLLLEPMNSVQVKMFAGRISGGLVVKASSDNAKYAGLQVGDFIIGVANSPITSVSQLQQITNRAKVGQSIVLKIARINGNSIVSTFIAVPVSK
ncbi:MAG: Do family serine endopeptidase [Burkholderiales bacterium]|nr:Do family serine endopeptidase [Burkholderiales bacterium]